MNQIVSTTVFDDVTTVTVLTADGAMLTFSEKHPNYTELMDALGGGCGDADLAELFSPLKAAERKFRKVSDHVELDGNTLLFDGDPIDTKLSRAILARFNAGDADWRALVAFLERLAANPSANSRRHLFFWLDERDIQFCSDGSFIAYKGVRIDGSSVHAGPGIVDGVAMDGHLPNEIGSTLTMDRAMVDPDRRNGCSVGLHVGTFDYARDFGDRVLTCKVDPADVVEVPMDCGFQKIRVCRYQVLAVADPHRLSDTLWSEDGDTWDEEDDDE